MWIDVERVSTILQTDLSDDVWIERLIDHVQGLAELEIGEQDSPSAQLQSVFAEIVARKWQAGQSANINPAAIASETTGPFAMSDPGARSAGLGLTNVEKESLRKAAGKGGLWVQPLSRGTTLETAPTSDSRRDVSPEQLVSVDGGDAAAYFDQEDLP